MPTVLRRNGFRFFFYAADLVNEPPHIHVRKGGSEAKFWLDPVRPARNVGYRPHELHQVELLILKYHDYLLSCWHKEMHKP